MKFTCPILHFKNILSLQKHGTYLINKDISDSPWLTILSPGKDQSMKIIKNELYISARDTIL